MNQENDKWKMFKNYMHNELGITREDIQQWINDAVHAEAQRLVNQEVVRFSIDEIVRKFLIDNSWYADKDLCDKVRQACAKQLVEKMTLSLTPSPKKP